VALLRGADKIVLGYVELCPEASKALHLPGRQTAGEPRPPPCAAFSTFLPVLVVPVRKKHHLLAAHSAYSGATHQPAIVV